MDYSHNEESGDATTPSSLKAMVKVGITGVGVGTTFSLGPASLGGFYTKYFESQKLDATSVSFGGAPQKQAVDSNYTQDKFGVGFALASGGAKAVNGYRLEASFTKMNFDGSNPLTSYDPGSDYGNAQARIAIEATKFGFTAGIFLTRTYGRFIDYKYYLDSAIAQFPYNTQPVDDYGGFFGFKSANGHSFGVSGSYRNGPTKSQLFGQNVPAISESSTVSASYAFLF